MLGELIRRDSAGFSEPPPPVKVTQNTRDLFVLLRPKGLRARLRRWSLVVLFWVLTFVLIGCGGTRQAGGLHGMGPQKTAEDVLKKSMDDAELPHTGPPLPRPPASPSPGGSFVVGAETGPKAEALGESRTEAVSASDAAGVVDAGVVDAAVVDAGVVDAVPAWFAAAITACVGGEDDPAARAEIHVVAVDGRPESLDCRPLLATFSGPPVIVIQNDGGVEAVGPVERLLDSVIKILMFVWGAGTLARYAAARLRIRLAMQQAANQATPKPKAAESPTPPGLPPAPLEREVDLAELKRLLDALEALRKGL